VSAVCIAVFLTSEDVRRLTGFNGEYVGKILTVVSKFGAAVVETRPVYLVSGALPSLSFNRPSLHYKEKLDIARAKSDSNVVSREHPGSLVAVTAAGPLRGRDLGLSSDSKSPHQQPATSVSGSYGDEKLINLPGRDGTGLVTGEKVPDLRASAPTTTSFQQHSLATDDGFQALYENKGSLADLFSLTYHWAPGSKPSLRSGVARVLSSVLPAFFEAQQDLSHPHAVTANPLPLKDKDVADYGLPSYLPTLRQFGQDIERHYQTHNPNCERLFLQTFKWWGRGFGSQYNGMLSSVALSIWENRTLVLDRAWLTDYLCEASAGAEGYFSCFKDVALGPETCKPEATLQLRKESSALQT